MADKQETITDIIKKTRAEADYIEETARGSLKAGENYDGIAYTKSDLESALDLAETKRKEADRLEAAHKREVDSIHRAMVILAGIEMPDPNYPPKLWTALEDAYDALSDALGTDGDTTADEEEAKSNGRHFVIQPRGDCAKMREALEAIISGYEKSDLCDMNYGEWCHDPANICVNVPLCKAIHEARAALAAPARNCDVGTAEEQSARFRKFCRKRSMDRLEATAYCAYECPCGNNYDCKLAWAQLPYESEATDGE